MRIRNGIITLLFFTVCCFNRPTEVAGLSELGFNATPDAVIAALEKNSPDAASQFMLGMAYKKKGMLKKGVLHYANSCFVSRRDYDIKLFPQPVYLFVRGFAITSPYYQDAVLEIANIFYQYREYEYVIKFTELVKKQRSGVYRDSVLLRARSLAELGTFDEALRQLHALRGMFDNADSKALIFIRIASVYEKSNDYEKAVDAYSEILRIDSAGWQSGIAADNIMALVNKKNIQISPDTRLLLAAALIGKKDYAEAIALIEDARALWHDASGAQRAAEYLVMAYAGRGDIANADTTIRGFAHDTAFAESLEKTKADMLWETKKRGAAAVLYARLSKSKDPEIARNSLRRAAMYAEDRRVAGFEGILAEYKNTYPDDAASGYFIWRLGRESVKRGKSDSAIAYFEEGLSKFPAGEYSDRMRFWMYKLLESSGRKQDAEKQFKDIVTVNPDSTYAWTLLHAKLKEYDEAALARQFEESLAARDLDGCMFAHTLLFLKERSTARRSKRLQRMRLPEKERYDTLYRSVKDITLRSAYKESLRGIEKYFKIGHNEGIARELGILPNDTAAQNDKNVAICHYGMRHDHSYYSLFALIELMKAVNLKENIAVMPEGMLACMLPTPWAECVKSNALEYKLERSFIYAIAKAESLFNPRAVSSAGAVGLMQLMPATAHGVARDLKIIAYDLKDPCTSIRFGARYFKFLDRLFPGNHDLMVAGYNAGAGNVKKWMKEMPAADLDYFVEFAAFEETRYYVVRTRKFMYQYRVVLGE